jgi:hypothetical protein
MKTETLNMKGKILCIIFWNNIQSIVVVLASEECHNIYQTVPFFMPLEWKFGTTGRYDLQTRVVLVFLIVLNTFRLIF